MQLGDGDGLTKGRPGNKEPSMVKGGDQENEEKERKQEERKGRWPIQTTN